MRSSEDGTIPCITVFQPFADFLVSGIKHVENRRHRIGHRGWLLIHAGLGRSWLHRWKGERPGNLAFGAIVGAVHLVDCLRIEGIRAGLFDAEYPWLKTHEHIMGGPWCWVCDGAVRFERPVAYSGKQGLYRVEAGIVADQLGNILNQYREPIR